jgi:hypothetical protein
MGTNRRLQGCENEPEEDGTMLDLLNLILAAIVAGAFAVIAVSDFRSHRNGRPH